MENTRNENMTRIAQELTTIIRTYGRRKDVCVTFICPTADEIPKIFSEWQRMQFHPHSGDELFLFYGDDELLYVVNVSADAYLTAIWEAMDLASRKF